MVKKSWASRGREDEKETVPELYEDFDDPFAFERDIDEQQ